MRTFLIGHRGVGKSTVLRKLESLGHETYDLDDEIVRRHGAIEELFKKGEAHFRGLESAVLTEVAALASPDAWIALGAGFSDWSHLALAASHRRIVWLTRASDQTGRIFLNRPRLEQGQTPLEEFVTRRDLRAPRFEAIADQIIELDPYTVKEIELPKRLLAPRQTLPPQLAVCTRGERHGPAEWALEDGLPRGEFKILSSHASDLDAVAQLERAGRDYPEAILKYAPMVASWREIERGHAWAALDRNQRAFLPRSESGRWAWYRLLMAPVTPITFFKEGRGTAPDQPSVDAWFLREGLKTNAFAAVLGAGVRSSASPAFHREFFYRRGLTYLAIEVARDEWEEALPVLTGLGLKFASVTAPLKQLAAESLRWASNESINTMYYDGLDWHGRDTDAAGWRAVALSALPEPRVLWGGQAVGSRFGRESLGVNLYSAREGRPRDGSQEVSAPATLIWAVPRSATGVSEPPRHWRPEVVLDLNYAEDSPGLEFALTRGVQDYRSGVEFFRAQAESQQEYWNECQPLR